jgi:hypothetical protein
MIFNYLAYKALQAIRQAFNYAEMLKGNNLGLIKRVIRPRRVVTRNQMPINQALALNDQNNT